MKFNYRQKTTALGQVLAFVAVIFLCYTSFLGLVYMRGGNIISSAVAAGVAALVLLTLGIAAQRCKGAEAHFKRNIRMERVLVALLIPACLAILVPFSHFFSVWKHEKEVSRMFIGAIRDVEPMFDDYEKKANARIEAYEKALDKAIANKGKKQYSQMGFSRHSDGKPYGGDRIMRDNMAATLRNQLLPPRYTLLKREAVQWTAKAASGATTLNAFLIGNTKEISNAVDGWQKAMEDMLATTLDNEPKKTAKQNNSIDNQHAENIKKGLQQVAEICQERHAPSPLAIAMAALCWALLLFPYWLQNRHSKSWESFWPECVRKRMRKKLPPERDTTNVAQVRMDWRTAESYHKAHNPSAAMKKRLAEAFDPYLQLMGEMENNGMTNEKLCDMLAKDHNLMDASTVSECLAHGVVTSEQLIEKCGIDRQFVSMIGSMPGDVLPEGGTIQHLGDASTEIFLWGIPSSGKTCALGVILAAAREQSVVRAMTVDSTCQGFMYEETLRRMFGADGNYCILPGRTPVATNFAIRLTLDDWNNRQHPITLVDMAGELFCSILWQNSGRNEQVNNNHRYALQEFQKILVTEKSEHQKIHFFIIEYGAEDKKYKGFDQDTYLEFGLRFLEDTGVLRNATEAVYVLVTKTDQVRANLTPGESFENHLAAYLRTYYPNFLGLLDKCCREYELCGGQMPGPIPFDIGEVCFNNYCHISTARARDVVKVMLAKSKGFRKGWKGKVEQWFSV